MNCLIYHAVAKAGSTVRFEITVRYEMFLAKSTVRNNGTIYFPRYGTVRKYGIFFVLLSNLFWQTTQVRYYGTIFNRTGIVRNNFLGTVRNYGSIFFPGSNYEKISYRTILPALAVTHLF